MDDDKTLPCNRLPNLRRRARRARRFPDNTCPSSRHLHSIAESLAAGKPYKGCAWDGWDKADQQWIAGTMLSVLESLWKARTALGEPPPRDPAGWEVRMDERITAAAIWPRGAAEPCWLPPPKRHHDIIRKLAAQGVRADAMDDHRQGFMTDTGRFVTRLDARKIAEAAGQMLRRQVPGNRLYSEDVW